MWLQVEAVASRIVFVTPLVGLGSIRGGDRRSDCCRLILCVGTGVERHELPVKNMSTSDRRLGVWARSQSRKSSACSSTPEATSQQANHGSSSSSRISAPPHFLTSSSTSTEYVENCSSGMTCEEISSARVQSSRRRCKHGTHLKHTGTKRVSLLLDAQHELVAQKPLFKHFPCVLGDRFSSVGEQWNRERWIVGDRTFSFNLDKCQIFLSLNQSLHVPLQLSKKLLLRKTLHASVTPKYRQQAIKRVSARRTGLPACREFQSVESRAAAAQNIARSGSPAGSC